MTRGVTSDSSDKPQAETRAESGPEEKRQERRTPFLLLVLPEIILFVVSVVLFIMARNFDYVASEGQLGPGFWPQVICVGIAVCAAVNFALKTMDHRRPVDEAGSAKTGAVDAAGDEEEDLIQWPRVALGIALVIAYPLATIFVGYPLATALLLIVFLYLGGQRKWYIVPIGVLGSLLFTYVFSGVVYISLPYGVGIFGNLTSMLYQLLGLQ